MRPAAEAVAAAQLKAEQEAAASAADQKANEKLDDKLSALREEFDVKFKTMDKRVGLLRKALKTVGKA